MRSALLFVLLLAPLGAAADPAASAERVRVPAGVVLMGSRDGDPDERPVHRVRVPAFNIDRTEVTQGAYDRCVAAGACTRRRRYPGIEGASLPAVGVSWHQARAFCRHAGGDLPDEAQWARAARGDDGRTYPWGEQLSCARGNFGVYAGAGLCAEKNPGKVTPVGGHPWGRGPFGTLDQGGNAWEWTRSAYRPYPGGRLSAPPPPGGAKVLRGGSCCSYFIMPRAANRLAFPPSYRDKDIGFRCAFSAKGDPAASNPRPGARKRGKKVAR